MNEPQMFYFGPWDKPGHYLFGEHGRSIGHRPEDRPPDFPWNEHSSTNGIDCQLQPGCYLDSGHWRSGPQVEGQAAVHHNNGWTALAFWDRSVDSRANCNSTYFAKGTFTFEEMVEMARTRFKSRWDRHAFRVRLAASERERGEVASSPTTAEESANIKGPA